MDGRIESNEVTLEKPKKAAVILLSGERLQDDAGPVSWLYGQWIAGRLQAMP